MIGRELFPPTNFEITRTQDIRQMNQMKLVKQLPKYDSNRKKIDDLSLNFSTSDQ